MKISQIWIGGDSVEEKKENTKPAVGEEVIAKDKLEKIAFIARAWCFCCPASSVNFGII